MHFPKIWVLKFQTSINHSIFVSEEKLKKHSTQNCIHYNAPTSDLKKKKKKKLLLYIEFNILIGFLIHFLKYIFLNK